MITFPERLPIPDSVVELARRLDEAGHEVWCVGGAVRDALLGHGEGDYDLATSATPEQVQALFPRTVPVGIKFGTVGVFDRRRVLHEITTFRRDVETDGRHAVVAYGVSLDDDLARRDFTINAIAYHPLRYEWKDPFAGAADLDARVVRAVGSPGERFREDYLRVLRALRFAARLGFSIEAATWDAARRAASGLSGLSAERVREEWFKGLKSAASLERLVLLWQDSGAAGEWLPELVVREPRSASWKAIDDSGRDPILLTVLLCPADPAAVLRRLRASNAEIDRAAAMAAGPSRPEHDDVRSVRRWLAATEPAANDLLELFHLTHGNRAPWSPVVAGIRERGEPLQRKDLAVTGADLMSAGVASGPALGEALERLLQAVLDDPTLNQRDVLLRLARGSD